MTNLVCIVCPRGCQLQVDENLNVTGNTCKRGEIYGKQEVKDPKRIVTTTCKVDDPIFKTCSCKTSDVISKSEIFDVCKEIKTITLKRPIHIGDIIIENVLGLGVNVVATSNIE